MMSILLRIFGFFLLLFLPIFGQCQLFEFKENLKWGLINAKGELILPATYDRINATVSRTHFYLHEGGKVGIYHRTKGMISQPVYDHVFPLEKGYFVMANQGLYGIIDTLGKVIASPQYDRLRQSGTYFYTYTHDKMGLLQAEAGELLQAKYDTIYRYDSTYFVVVEKGQLGLADTEGKMVEAPLYSSISHFYQDLYLFHRGKVKGLKAIGAEEFVLPLRFDRIETFEQKELVLQASRKGWSSLYNFKGEMVADSIVGQFKEYFEDLYVYKKGKGVGLMDLETNLLTEAVFSRMKPLEGDYILVQRNKRYGLISRTGRLIIPSDYSQIRLDGSSRIWVRQKKLWGIHSKEGKLIFLPTFSKPGSFEHHVAVVSIRKKDTVKKNGRAVLANVFRYGLVNQFGEYLAPPQYEAIKVYSETAQLKIANVDSVKEIGFTKEGKANNKVKIMLANSSWRYSKRTLEQETEAELARIDWGYTARSIGVEGSENMNWVREKGLWGLRIGGAGNEDWKIPPKYQSIQEIPNTDLVMVSVLSQDKRTLRYGLVSTDYGKDITAITHHKIFIEDFAQGERARVIGDDKLYNILNTNGHSTIARGKNYRTFWNRYSNYGIKQAPTYIGEIQGDWTRVCFAGRLLSHEELNSPQKEQLLQKGGGIWAMMKLDGSFELKPVYGYLGELVNGTFCFKYKDQWGIMDTSFQMVSEAQYNHLHDPGKASPLLVNEHKAHKLSVLSMNGKYISSLILDERNEAYKIAKIQNIGQVRENMLAFKQRGKWGFMDMAGDIAIEPQYAEVGDFHEGLARVKVGRYWGFIDSTGAIVIEAEYRKAQDFEQGLAAVGEARAWNFINKLGKKAIKYTFSKIQPFEQGKAIVKEAKSDQWGLIDTLGSWLIKPDYDEITLHEGYYRVRQKQKYGYFNSSIEAVLPVEHDFLGEISEGKMAIRSNRSYGFADLSGNVLIKPAFDLVQGFHDGMAAVRIGREWGYINDQGETVIEAKYTQVMPFVAGVAAVAKKASTQGRAMKWGFIDQTGKEIVPLIYQEVHQSEQGILICKNAQAHWNYFDRYGITISNTPFDSASKYEYGLSKATQASHSFLLNAQGQRLTNPGYDEINSWGNPYILSTSLHRRGLIDRSGTEILPAEYEQIHFYEGLYQIINDGKVGYLNATGDWIWPLME